MKGMLAVMCISALLNYDVATDNSGKYSFKLKVKLNFVTLSPVAKRREYGLVTPWQELCHNFDTTFLCDFREVARYTPFSLLRKINECDIT